MLTRFLLLLPLLGLALPTLAQHTLYVCAANTTQYVVGAKLAPSGVFRKTVGGAWESARSSASAWAAPAGPIPNGLGRTSPTDRWRAV